MGDTRAEVERAPTITIQPTLGNGHAIEAIGHGIRAVAEGTDQPPQYFTEQVLVDLKKMRRLFSRGNGAKSISVFTNGAQAVATIGPDIAEKVGRILTADYYSLGSLQGALDTINVHGSPTVTVWDRVSRMPVRCSIPKEDEWIAHVKGLLGKRVSVTGKIRYFINGNPRSITDVTEIEDATHDPNLLRAEFGSIPDRRVIEIGAVEWLDSIRGFSEE